MEHVELWISKKIVGIDLHYLLTMPIKRWCLSVCANINCERIRGLLLPTDTRLPENFRSRRFPRLLKRLNNRKVPEKAADDLAFTSFPAKEQSSDLEQSVIHNCNIIYITWKSSSHWGNITHYLHQKGIIKTLFYIWKTNISTCTSSRRKV